MKKNTSKLLIAALASSAIIAPISSVASAATPVQDGVYFSTTNEFFTVEQLSDLSTQKIAKLFEDNTSSEVYIYKAGVGTASLAQANVSDFISAANENGFKDEPGKIIPEGTYVGEDGNDIVIGDEVAPEVTVESVMAINATQVEVKFSTPVDKADAEKANQVSIQNVTLANSGKGKLSEDGKTLTLTATAPINVTDAAVVVNPIQTKADANVKTEKYVSLFTYKDVVAPTIASVEAVSNGTTAKSLTVKASEPVKTGALVKVNGKYETIDFNGTDTATVTGISLKTGETHTIELINLEDLAGNKTVSTSASFTVSVDATAPTATLTQKEDSQILVTFNKKMDVASVEAALAAANNPVKDEALGNVTTGNAYEVSNSNGTQFIIPVTESTLYDDQDSRTLSVVLKDSIKDTLGNKIATTTQKVTLTKDVAKPAATGYNLVKDADGKVKEIELNFSKGLAANAIAANTALTNSAVTSSIVDEDGVLDTTTFADFKSQTVNAGDTTVVFKYSPAAPNTATSKTINGKYAFSFAKDLVEDQAKTPNKSVAFNYTINFGEGKQDAEFTLVSAAATNATSNKITVNFGEAVKGGAVSGSATDLSNYTLAGKPLPEGTTITLSSDQETATITLPEGSVAKDDQASIFTVANVKNTAGTKTVKTFKGTVAVADNVKPVLGSAKVLDNKSIELTYDEAMVDTLSNSDVSGDFIIKNGSTTAIVFSANELKANNVPGFDNKVRITIDKDNADALDGEADVTGTNASKVTTGDATVANGTSEVDYKVTEKVTAPEVTGTNANRITANTGNADDTSAVNYGVVKVVTATDVSGTIATAGAEEATGSSEVTYTVVDPASDGNLELQNADGDTITVASGTVGTDEVTFSQDGVTITVVDTATENDTFTVTTTKTVTELQNTADSSVVIADLADTQTFVQDGVTFTVAGAAADGETFTVATTKTLLQLLDAEDNSVVIADLVAAQTFTQDGVTFTVAGAADGDTFKVNTTAAVAATEFTLNLDEDITVETKDSTIITDNSAKKNHQKAGVKLTVVKP